MISQHFSRIYQEARQRLAVSNCIMYGRHLPFDLTTRISEFSISKSHHEVYCNAFHSSGYFFILFLILSCVPRKKVWFSRVAIFYFSVIAYIRALCLFQFFLVVVVIMSLRRAKGTEQCAFVPICKCGSFQSLELFDLTIFINIHTCSPNSKKENGR